MTLSDHDAPTPEGARLPTLDILRGVALLGIFTVNMLFFSSPAGYFGIVGAAGTLDGWLERAVRISFQGAFYSLFSLLFGVGFALQLRRGPHALPRFRRRLAVLLGIGLLHAVLVWYGDILVAYAVAGFILTLFAFRRPPVLVAGALIFFALSCASYLGFADLNAAPPAPWVSAAAFTETFGGSYLGTVQLQARMAAREFLTLPTLLPTVLWLFLLGLLAGQQGLFARPNRRVWLVVLAAALPVALFFKGFYAYWLLTGSYHPFSTGFSFAIGGPALMLVYLALLSLLLAEPAWQRRLRFFGDAGRMALTNYLTQSLVCTLVFNGYGLGLYGELALRWALLLVLVVFAAQVLFSRFWLARFRFGPAEWVWRSLTYGRWQPLRRAGLQRA